MKWCLRLLEFMYSPSPPSFLSVVGYYSFSARMQESKTIACAYNNDDRWWWRYLISGVNEYGGGSRPRPQHSHCTLLHSGALCCKLQCTGAHLKCTLQWTFSTALELQLFAHPHTYPPFIPLQISINKFGLVCVENICLKKKTSMIRTE